MNSRKDMIYEKIVTYTRESILDNSFSFEHCNAFDIAVELKIDRSNVSRILNQLFNDYLLIKISGRPTTYLSREVIVNEFRYSKAPQIIANRKELKEQLVTNEPMAASSLPDFQIIGSNIGESLHEVIDTILPCFIYPQADMLLFVLMGKPGSGRKYFCRQLFSYALKKKTFPKQSTYVTVSWRPDAENNQYILNELIPETTAMILIEVTDEITERKIYRMKSDISHLYSNQGCHPPVIIFLVDKDTVKADIFASLTPCVVSFPNLAQRRTVERLKIILTIMQETADYNHTQIRVNRDILTRLLSSRYKYNISQLRSEIHYAVAGALYYAQGNTATLLTNFLSAGVRSNQTENQNYLNEITDFVEHSIPEFIDLYPDTECTILTLLSSDNMSSILTTPRKKSFDETVWDDVLHTDVTLDNQILEERLHFLLGFCFQQSPIRYDIPMLNRLYALISDMIHGTFNTGNLLEDETLPQCSRTSSKLSATLIDKIESSFNATLAKSSVNYLRLFLDHALRALDESNIIYVIVSYDQTLAENYASYLNYISGTRSYYVLPFGPEDQHHYPAFVKRSQKLIANLNDSKEIIVVTDKPPLTNLSTLLVAALNRTILSLYPITMPMLMRTLTIMKEDNMHALPTVRKILYSKKETMKGYNEKITGFPNEYISKLIAHHFERCFDGINTALSCKILYNILKDVFDYFGCELKTGLVLEFLFHGNAALYRSTRNETVCMDKFEERVSECGTTYQILNKRIHQSRELLALNLDETEVLLLCELLIDYTDSV